MRTTATVPSATGPAWLVLVALAACLLAGPTKAGASQGGPDTSTPRSAEEHTLVSRVRTNLEKERRLLLEYTYHEKRRPIRVTPLGKVSLEPEQTFAVFPSADPDRPNRVLVAIDGRPPTEEEGRAFTRRRGRNGRGSAEDPAEREHRNAERRRRAQDRLNDAFRVFRLEPAGEALLDGVRTRIVRITPRPETPTRSDVGRWLKKFVGTAWVHAEDAELVRLELTATDTISLGWGVIGRVAAGTRVTYERRRTHDGVWFPASARFDARGRTLMFRPFAVESVTEWFDYRPYSRAAQLGHDTGGTPGARP